jgi:hypothetical protein
VHDPGSKGRFPGALLTSLSRWRRRIRCRDAGCDRHYEVRIRIRETLLVTIFGEQITQGKLGENEEANYPNISKYFAK